MEVHDLLGQSTVHRLARRASHFLVARGYDFTDMHPTYHGLAALAEQSDSDRTGLLVPGKLKPTLADLWSSQPWRRKQEVSRLVRQLQVKCQFHTLRSKVGKILPKPVEMAQEIFGFLSNMISSSGQPFQQVSEYLRSLFKDKPLADMPKMLIKQPSEDLVPEALESLNTTSSPSIDGFTGVIYKNFADHFVLLMYHIYQGLVDSPSVPGSWSVALLNTILKTAGMAGVQDVRPLVLQKINNKWVPVFVSLQLHDFVATISPMHSRQPTLSATPQIIFCPVDFSKAFDSVTLVYAKNNFPDAGIPRRLINLLMALFTAPSCLLVREAVLS